MFETNTLAVEEVEIAMPQDLITLNEMASKYGCSYDYWYKWSVREKVIPAHYCGTWKVSEKDIQEFNAKITKERLYKVKQLKGGE